MGTRSSKPNSNDWRTATIVLGVVAGVLLFGVVATAIVWTTNDPRKCQAVAGLKVDSVPRETDCPVPLWPAHDPEKVPPHADGPWGVPVEDIPVVGMGMHHRTAGNPPPKWEGRIPARIYQTHKYRKVPERMAQAARLLQERNPDFEYVFFDDREARAWIEREMDDGGRCLRVFDTLIPGAFKADLFRYCLLWKQGGVYLDTGIVANLPLREVLRPDDRFVSCDDGVENGIWQAVLAAEPGSPILRHAIDLVCDRVERRETGTDALFPTGPRALGHSFREVVGADAEAGDHGDGVRLWHHRIRNRACESQTVTEYRGEDLPDGVQNRLIFWTKYPGYHADQRNYPKRENRHYGELWNTGKVFSKLRGKLEKEARRGRRAVDRTLAAASASKRPSP